MAWSDVSQTVKVLALLGKVNPEIFDVFPPHSLGVADRVEAVTLNPQPLPPRDPLVTGAIFMSRRLTQIAVEADVRGEDSAGWLAQIIDEWCGTPWPGKWPRPGPAPIPEGGPQPEPWAVNEARIAGAVVFASMASRLGDGDLQTALASGAERLAEVAAQEM